MVPLVACSTGILVQRPSTSASMLVRSGDKCSMTTNARLVDTGMFWKKPRRASIPPAEAPIPTTRRSVVNIVSGSHGSKLPPDVCRQRRNTVASYRQWCECVRCPAQPAVRGSVRPSRDQPGQHGKARARQIGHTMRNAQPCEPVAPQPGHVPSQRRSRPGRRGAVPDQRCSHTGKATSKNKRTGSELRHPRASGAQPTPSPRKRRPRWLRSPLSRG